MSSLSFELADGRLSDAPSIDRLQGVYEEEFGRVPKRLERVRWRVVRAGGELVGAYSICDDLRLSQHVRMILDFYVCRGRSGVVAAYAMGEEIVREADELGLTVNGIVNPQNARMVKPLGGLAFFPTGILVTRKPEKREPVCLQQ